MSNDEKDNRDWFSRLLWSKDGKSNYPLIFLGVCSIAFNVYAGIILHHQQKLERNADNEISIIKDENGGYTLKMKDGENAVLTFDGDPQKFPLIGCAVSKIGYNFRQLSQKER